MSHPIQPRSAVDELIDAPAPRTIVVRYYETTPSGWEPRISMQINDETAPGYAAFDRGCHSVHISQEQFNRDTVVLARRPYRVAAVLIMREALRKALVEVGGPDVTPERFVGSSNHIASTLTPRYASAALHTTYDIDSFLLAEQASREVAKHHSYIVHVEKITPAGNSVVVATFGD